MRSTSKTRAKQRSKSRLKQRNPKGTRSPIPLGEGAFQMGPSLTEKQLKSLGSQAITRLRKERKGLSESEMDFLKKLMSKKNKFMF